MILITHKNNKVVTVLDGEGKALSNIFIGKSIPKTIFQIAGKYTDTLIVWCEVSYVWRESSRIWKFH